MLTDVENMTNTHKYDIITKHILFPNVKLLYNELKNPIDKSFIGERINFYVFKRSNDHIEDSNRCMSKGNILETLKR